MQQQRRCPPVPVSPVAQNNHSSRPIRQSSRNMPPAVSQCFGCSQPMYNQFISNVLDHLWHPECVRCFICRCVLNEQCYSREGKLYCKDDFIKKYIHRCFACQNLIQSHELIRRIRVGRMYHAECFVCSKCKRTLQDDDIIALLKPEGATLNDLDCMCQPCLNPNKTTDETTSSSNEEENKTKDNEVIKAVNGKASPVPETQEEKRITNGTSITNDHVDEQQSMEVDEPPPQVTKLSKSPVKESSPPSNPATPPPKTTGRQSKVRQSTGSNGSKRSPTKSKTTPASRQKQTTVSERKGRSPATRSKASAGTSATPPVVQRRSSNRRTAKTTRYRKRSFSSGSDEDETEDEDDDDTDFTEEDNMPDNEQEINHSSAIKNKSSTNSNEKKPESELPPSVTQPATLPLLPPQTTTNPSLLSQAKMSEPLSLLSGLAANPMSISSIMKPDVTASFMPPNFNPAFPTPAQFLPPGFPLQPRLPMPPPPPPPSSSSSATTSHPQTTSTSDPNHSADASDTDSLDRSSSPSQMDVSTNAEPGTPARPATPPKGARSTTSSTKPSALSSLLEFGTIPPSTLGDIRASNAPPNPFPFPFVTPGPGVPFSPQAAAGMATFYRPPFGAPPPQSAAMPLDMSQSKPKSSKKKSDTTDNEEIISQNLLDDSSTSSSSPKKKARKSNARGKSKAKKNDTDGENGIDEDNPSPPLPPPAPSETKKKKKKLKTDVTENGNTNDSDETKITNGNANNHSHNFLAQMGLLNNSFMPPMPTSAGGAAGTTTNGKTPTAQQAQQAQQAQLAAMYNMAPHFAAYNAFPGAFNPAFAAAAYAGGYPPPYGFHPAFGAPTPGQPFPFMPQTAVPPGGSPVNNSSTGDDKANTSETKSGKSRGKNNAGGEKKKASAPRSNKKKSIVPSTTTDIPVPTEGEPGVAPTSSEATPPVANTPDSISTPTKRQMSGSDSDDLDEPQQHSQTTNGKSGNESDDSAGDGDRSLSALPSAAPEKKGARTTIKPQQLDILCKAYDSCSKPNKPQREQLVAETGLSLRVIQVWFQNRRSKERKGKTPKERETTLDDDEAGEDSQPSPPPTTSESIPMNETET